MRSRCRRKYPDAVLVFVRPPSRDVQRARLGARGEDSPEQIERRLAAAAAEEQEAEHFDFVVENDDVDRAVAEVAAILARRRACRPKREAAVSPLHRGIWRSPTMAERRASLMQPRVEDLMEQVDSKFTLVTLAAMRAREINDYYNQLGEGLGRIVPPQVTSVSRKPLSIALEEIDAGKIMFERVVEAPDEPEAAADADRPSGTDATA